MCMRTHVHADLSVSAPHGMLSTFPSVEVRALDYGTPLKTQSSRRALVWQWT